MRKKLTAKRFSHLQEIEAHEIGRPHFRFKNPLAGGLGDFVVQPEWDFYGIAASTACVQQTLFSIPQGQNFTITGGATFAKTLQTTSMQLNAQLQPPERLLVRGIQVFLDNTMNQGDVAKAVSQILLNFNVSTKSFFVTNLLAKLPAGGGGWAQQFGATAATTIIGVVGNGIPNEHQGYAVTAPGAQGFSATGDPNEIAMSTFPQIDGILIAQQQAFKVVVDPTLAAHIAAAGFSTAAAGAVPPGTGLNMFVHLEGTKARAVL
jgi:hypothetical protein